MPTVRFNKAFRYHPRGMAGVTVKRGDIAEVSDEIAASAVRSGAGVEVDLDAEKAVVEAEKKQQAAKEAANEANLDLVDPANTVGSGDGKTGPIEDKSVSPSEDKADEDDSKE